MSEKEWDDWYARPISEHLAEMLKRDPDALTKVPKRDEKGLIRREFPAVIERMSGDGRTLDVRIVPYNETATVSDPPYYEPYQEEWLPGAFDKQIEAAHRVSVFVNVEHEQGIQGIVGRGTHLRETPAGLEGTFRMLDHPDADKALQLVNEGDLTGISLEAVTTKSVRENGVVKRVKARLVNIALVRPSGSPGGIQAFKGAGVLAVREVPPEEPTPDEPAPEPAPEDEPDSQKMNIVGGVSAEEFRVVAAMDKPSEEQAREFQAKWDEASRVEIDKVLERVGYEPLLKRAITSKPWVGSTSRFSDEEYQRSCLIDRGGDAPVKERCSLPVLEPDGDLNVHALGQAAARINQLTGVDMAQKAAAARKLMRLYRKASMPIPPNVMAMAAR